MIHQKSKRLKLGIMLGLILLPFQNCTAPLGQTANSSIAAKNLERSNAGGQGYDGKITYINRVTEGLCSDGSRVRSAVESANGKNLIIRDACQSIAPIAISDAEFALMAHNRENAVHAGHVFDLLSTKTDPNLADSMQTKYLCRGAYDRKGTDERQVADVLVRYKQDGKVVHSVKVIMAVYKASVLKEILQTDELEVRSIETEVTGRLKYGTPMVGRHQATLWIDKTGDTKTGKLAFIDLPYPGRDKEPDYNYRDYERIIQNLNCFQH